jgi:hypothetical protein
VITEIHEPVVVSAEFGNGIFRIRKIVWKNISIQVQKITFRWHSRRNIFPLYHFAVSDGGRILELTLDTESLSWELERIHIEG